MLLDPQVRTLSFAVRPRVVARHLGQLFAPLAALLTVPLAVWVARLPASAWLPLAGVTAALALGAVLLARIRAREDIQSNEAMVIVALAFCLAPLALAVPLVGIGVPWLDALFHAVSGITTTGLSTLGPRPGDGFAVHFYAAWMQWIGGLGVVVLAVALLVSSGPALRRLGVDERETESLAGGTRAHARHALVVYLILTALAVALLATGTSPANALLHALAAVSTGGFSPLSGSAGDLEGGWAQGVLAVACLAGAIAFSFYYRGLYRRPKELLADEGLRVLLAQILLATALVWLIESLAGAGAAPADVAFTAISAQTTAGFSPVDPGTLAPASKLVLMGSMFVGGDVGSTAGGLKILRVLILIRLLELVLARASVARGARLTLRAEGRPVTPREVELAVALFVAHLVLVGVCWLAFLAHGMPALDALFDVVSAVSLTGLSTGVTGPDLAPGLKLVLCVAMIAGRVETLALVVLLYPGTWLGKRRGAR